MTSINLQYNTLGCWVAGTIVPPSYGPISQQFLQNSSHNYFYHFYCFIFFYNLKKVKCNSLLTLWNVLRPSHQPTVLFPIYQNNDWTIRRWDVCPINPATQLLFWRLLDVRWWAGKPEENQMKNLILWSPEFRIFTQILKLRRELAWVMFLFL